MHFAEPLIEGRLVERYKRFLADIDLESGERVTAHCANPGAMLGLKEPGSRVFLSRASNPNRKLKFNWEFVEVAAGGGPSQLVGINTSRPNLLVAEALKERRLAPFAEYDRVRPEVKYGRNSRIDFLLDRDGAPPCYLEVKNCHLMRQAGFAEFPDCIAARSAKHMYELSDMVAGGARAAARLRDPDGSRTGSMSHGTSTVPTTRPSGTRSAAGVECYAYTCRITLEGVSIDRPVPIVTLR